MLNYKQIWHGIKPIRWLNKFNLTVNTSLFSQFSLFLSLTFPYFLKLSLFKILCYNISSIIVDIHFSFLLHQYILVIKNFFMVLEPSSAIAQYLTMATSSSTMASSSSTSSVSSSSAMNLVNQPLLLLSNMLNMMTVKSDHTNYIVWKHQNSMVLNTYSLFE